MAEYILRGWAYVLAAFVVEVSAQESFTEFDSNRFRGNKTTYFAI